MNRKDELVKALSIKDVEYRTLADIFIMQKGYTPSKNCHAYWQNGVIPWFRIEDIRLHGHILKDAIKHVNMQAIKSKFFAADSIILSTNVTIGEHALIKKDFLANQQFTVFTLKEEMKQKILIEYIYYYFYIIGKNINKKVKGLSFPSVGINKLKKYIIPIPSKDKQKEIVDMLGQLTNYQQSLTEQIENEISKINKQYVYYRNKFLQFNDQHPLTHQFSQLNKETLVYKSLEDCCYILDQKRKAIAKKNRKKGKYPYYGANGIQDYINDYIFDGEYVLVGEDGSVIKQDHSPFVTWVKGKIWVNNHAHVLAAKEEIFLRYLYYYLMTIDIHAYVHGSVPKLTLHDLKKIKIALPPLVVQHEIVKILDCLERLYNNLRVCLQKEIESNRKKYDYYFEQLFTFE